MPNSFDQITDDYDQSFTYSAIGKYQRAIVHRYLLNILEGNKNQNILELNCGTGEDAVFLAKLGHSVCATDYSENMMRITGKKISLHKVEHCCKVVKWDLNNNYPPQINFQYDLIFSNFGGLNCLAPHALKQLSFCLNDLLKPGGRILLVIISTFCLTEFLYFSSKLRFKSAIRRLHKNHVTAHLSDHNKIPVWYYSANQVAKIFRPHFKFINQKPVGLFLPPSYLENYFANRKSLLNTLNSLEELAGNANFLSNFSDHYIIELQKHG